MAHFEAQSVHQLALVDPGGRSLPAHILLAPALSACYLGTNYSYRVYKGRPVANAEKISIALPTEMVAIVRRAVESGEYASSSEVVRDALRDWTHKRSLRQQGIAELRDLWRDALRDPTPCVAADEVLDRLERKYQAIADAANTAE